MIKHGTMRKKQEAITDDIAVGKQVIDTLFQPPIARSTFYKKVKEGVVVKCRAVDGYYMLNVTRRNLGLPQIDVLDFRERHGRDDRITFPMENRLAVVAMAVLLPELVRMYPPSFFPEWLSDGEVRKVKALAEALQPELEKAGGPLEQLLFAGGVIWGADLNAHKSADPNSLYDKAEQALIPGESAPS
jgi:hypothetical protein